MNTLKSERSFENLYSNEFEQKLAETPNAMVLDVRRPEEFRSGRISKAINIDVTDSSFIDKLSSLDKSKVYFVYCQGGGRSAQACSIMSRYEFITYNLAGGIANWKGPVR